MSETRKGVRYSSYGPLPLSFRRMEYGRCAWYAYYGAYIAIIVLPSLSNRDISSVGVRNIMGSSGYATEAIPPSRTITSLTQLS